MSFILSLSRGGKGGGHGLLCGSWTGFNYQQRFGLVNVKLKWVKDRILDAAVTGQGDLKAASTLVSIISGSRGGCIPVYHLSHHRRQLGLRDDVKVSSFLRRYPAVFSEACVVDGGGTRVPCFYLTREAEDLRAEEVRAYERSEVDLVERLCKFLMLTRDRVLPFQTIDQLRWDIGLPYGYADSVIPNYPDLFSLVNLVDDRVGLKLLVWDDRLAMSVFEGGAECGCSAFPVRFTRGFGLKRKCMAWLKEWQKLPYTSPYRNASHLDPRTDVSEKRIVGVFHEFLHLTLHKQTERKNVSNLRRPLSLPQKFTKVFERHPGIFYISKKNDTQTVVLREAYDQQKLLDRHPLVDIRERYAALMRRGFLDRSKGLYKKDINIEADADTRTKLSEVYHGDGTSEHNSYW